MPVADFFEFRYILFIIYVYRTELLSIVFMYM